MTQVSALTWTYGEDHVGQDQRLIRYAMAATLIGLVLVPVAVFVPSVWAGVAGAVFLAALLWYGVSYGRALGLRIGADRIWLGGGIAAGERRVAAGDSPWPKKQSAMLTNKQLVEARRDAVLEASVVRDGARRQAIGRMATVPPLRKGGQRRRRLGYQISRHAPGHLVLRVDPAQVGWPTLPRGTPYGYVRVPTDTRLAATELLAIPTRRPDQVAEQLTRWGVPEVTLPGT